MELLGRRLRLGIVGGGIGSMIGEVHRTAARISDSYQLVAAVLSPNPEASHADGKALAVPRVYGGWQEMLEAEALRQDGVDVVTVMTPNDSHAEIAKAMLCAGFHVLCEKPLTNSLQDAQILADCVAEMGKVFCVSFNYSMYAMVRQARALVRAGELGEIRQLHAEYIQGHNATLVEEASYNWRFDVSRGGPSMVMGAIASHAHHLLCSTVGLRVDKLLADLKGTVAGRKGHDYAALLLRMENGAPGSMWITNAASGGEHGLRMRIFGSKGSLEWCQETPGNLVHRRAHGFTQTITPSALLAQAAARGKACMLETGWWMPIRRHLVICMGRLPWLWLPVWQISLVLRGWIFLLWKRGWRICTLPLLLWKAMPVADGRS